MKYEIKYTAKFKKDYKQANKRGYDISKLTFVIETLSKGRILSEEYCDHALSGIWIGHHECHIQPDWLLIYYYEEKKFILTLSRTGTHSDLFGK